MVMTIPFMYNILKRRRVDGRDPLLGRLMAMPLSSMSTANHSCLMIRLDCLYQRAEDKLCLTLGWACAVTDRCITLARMIYCRKSSQSLEMIVISARSDLHFFASTSTFSGEGFLKQMLTEGIRMSPHCHGH